MCGISLLAALLAQLTDAQRVALVLFLGSLHPGFLTVFQAAGRYMLTAAALWWGGAGAAQTEPAGTAGVLQGLGDVRAETEALLAQLPTITTATACDEMAANLACVCSKAMRRRLVRLLLALAALQTGHRGCLVILLCCMLEGSISRVLLSSSQPNGLM